MPERQPALAPEPIRVLVGHPNRLLREALVDMLVGGGFHVVGHTDNAGQLSALVAEEDPRIVVLDWDMEGVCPGFVERLNGEGRVYVVFMTRPDNADGILERASAGARGYLSLQLDKKEFLESLRMVSSGNVLLSSDIAPRFREAIVGASDGHWTPKLSGREADVLRLVGEGASNREIAEVLMVSHHTVKAHLRSILSKLNLRNRQQMVVYAIQNGLVTDSDEIAGDRRPRTVE